VIAFARGTVVEAAGDRVVLDIGPIGLVLVCAPTTVLELRRGDHAELYTSMIVREDAWTVYGFADIDSRAVFEKVQTVTGIGPRIALALLGTMAPDDLRRAVAAGDEAALMKAPGIGRKGAQRIILELADRLGPASFDAVAGFVGSQAGGWQGSVIAGLVSLGWSSKDAERAVDSIDAETASAASKAGAKADISALLKAALRNLDRS
jgi:Holliday junction DNA helicase RuvA